MLVSIPSAINMSIKIGLGVCLNFADLYTVRRSTIRSKSGLRPHTTAEAIFESTRGLITRNAVRIEELTFPSVT